MNKNVTVEVADTKTIFKWRLKYEKEHSEWTSDYSGLLVHTFNNGEKWGVVTGYWGTLPEFTPFQIILPK